MTARIVRREFLAMFFQTKLAYVTGRSVSRAIVVVNLVTIWVESRIVNGARACPQGGMSNEDRGAPV